MKTRFYYFLFLSLILSLCIVDIGVAQEAASQPELSFAERMMRMLPMFIMVFFIFYFLVIRPQNKQESEKQSLLGSLKKGDQLVTSGGLLGKFSNVESEFVVLDLGNNMKVKVEANHIVKRLEKNDSKSKS